LAALVLSLIAHIILFFWLWLKPTGSLIAPPQETPFVATLKEEPVRQIKMARSAKKAVPQTGNTSSEMGELGAPAGVVAEQGGGYRTYHPTLSIQCGWMLTRPQSWSKQGGSSHGNQHSTEVEAGTGAYRVEVCP
jgi:hypothetical protein